MSSYIQENDMACRSAQKSPNCLANAHYIYTNHSLLTMQICKKKKVLGREKIFCGSDPHFNISPSLMRQQRLKECCCLQYVHPS